MTTTDKLPLPIDRLTILTDALWAICDADTYTHTTPSGFKHKTTGAFYKLATDALNLTGDR